MAQLYGKKTSDGKPKALECTDDGMLKVDTELTATIDPTGLATEATAGDIKTAVEALAVATPDTASGDLASMSADIDTMQTDLATVTADIALIKADLALVKASVSNAGTAYCKSDTAAADAARRFETTEKKIMNASITVETNAQLFGDSVGQSYTIDVGDTKSFGNIDISTLYFKNKVAGQNGTVIILGVEE